MSSTMVSDKQRAAGDIISRKNNRASGFLEEEQKHLCLGNDTGRLDVYSKNG